MDLGYAWVSTTKQDLDRQIVALEAAGIPAERIYVDKKSGATTNRPGLQAVMGYACAGDVIVVHTLDRLGRIVRDTLNLIQDLAGRGVGIRNLADPIKVDSANPDDPMGQLAVVLLALRWNAPTASSTRDTHVRARASSPRYWGPMNTGNGFVHVWKGHASDAWVQNEHPNGITGG